MLQPLIGFLAFAVGIVAIAVAPVLAVWLIMQIVKGLAWVIGSGLSAIGFVIGRVFRLAQGLVVDTLHFVGSCLTALAIAPLAIGSLALFRLRAGRHYGAALEDELMGAAGALYRVSFGHVVRFLGLGALTDGLERRLPDLVAEEPRTGVPASGWRARQRREKSRGEALARGETPAFEGYTVTNELRPGGSGARLFTATPLAAHAKLLAERGIDVPAQVVIKAFALGYGSTIPQIVRESRSLEAAKSLGLIVEHALEDDAFHYVMPFVPGDDLDVVTRKMHASSTVADGLDDRQFGQVLAYTRDLCDQLDRFHREGLWHKDVKPSNLMIADGRLHVVDFGLVTPLESALTLTTHGTEFFRDPELVRLALEGKRVKDVDGVKFDLYSAGAVLYSMVENSFPAHGSLSSISKRTPPALRWIVRRAMADIDKRYASAAEFGRDLDVLIAARDPFAVRPADLPSVRGEDAPRAARASFAGAASAAAAGAAAHGAVDVEAFGVRAEVRGLGRARRALHTAREARREERRARDARRVEARRVRDEARVAARMERRRRRRGIARALLTLLVFFGIVGGVATTVHQRQVARSFAQESIDTAYGVESRDRALTTASSAPSSPVIGTESRTEAAGPWKFSSSTRDVLESLGRGTSVLVAHDPRATASVRAAAAAIGRSVREFGLRPLGAGSDDPGDAAEIALVGDALHQVVLAGHSTQRIAERLSAFGRTRPEIGAILWLTEDSVTGYLQLQVLDARDRGEDAELEAWLESALQDDGCDASTSAAPAEVMAARAGARR